jgi:tetratricopeptide (TPR) repeat protein
MKVDYRLRRRPAGRPAVALLLTSSDARGVLDLCARLGLDPAGRVHAVSGGLLLRLDQSTEEVFAGAIRLRALAANLFLPVDAELIPALLDDEAEGLVRDRGLVFLPDGRVLGFNPRSPIAPSFLLAAARLERRPWRALPEAMPLAERIEEIRVELPGSAVVGAGSREADDPPEGAADAVLEPGGEGIGVEPPRPAPSGTTAGLRGRASLGAGRGLMALGQWLGLPGLARLGAQWVQGAVEMAPRLSESALGRQAAALRELLREFREGDPERALRRALPLGEPPGPRGGGADVEGRLPAQDLGYSLGALLDGGDRGPARVWLGGQEVMAELTREYRRAAEAALARGDYRRAAFIYGKLLRDYRAAAHALLRGGLYRDAAVLFLAKLDDSKAAARAFEAAGDVDRAVPLYRRAGEHEAAGDLLLRIGEEAAALAEYRLAAERLLASGAGHLAAGELLLAKAGRADLAREQFRAGWDRRPSANAVPCSLRLARLHADEGDVAGLRSLLDEADAFFDPDGNDHGASLFYNELADLASSPPLASVRDELHDRALLGLAAKLRQQAKAGTRPGIAVTSLLGRGPRWPAALVRDAEFAATAAGKRAAAVLPASPDRRAKDEIRVGSGIVTAACAAPESGEVFLGFEGGEVYCVRPATGEVVLVAAYNLPVVALSAEGAGRRLVVLREGGSGHGILGTFERRPDGSYRLLLGTHVDGLASPWLTPVRSGPGDDLVGLWDGQALYVFAVGSLTPRGTLTFSGTDAEPTAALLIPRSGGVGEEPAALIHDGSWWWLVAPDGPPARPTGLRGKPCLPEGSPLRCTPVSWARSYPEHLEMVVLDEHGTLDWANLRLVGGDIDLIEQGSSGPRRGYRAATLIKPGVVVGVSLTAVDRYTCGAGRLAFVHSIPAQLDSAVACFPSRRTHDLFVVDGEGSVRRVSLSGRPSRALR